MTNNSLTKLTLDRFALVLLMCSALLAQPATQLIAGSPARSTESLLLQANGNEGLEISNPRWHRVFHALSAWFGLFKTIHRNILYGRWPDPR